ncbi:MAG: hypothetical protein JRJ84_21535, partial [Deltaproteobacteria bacterium]|nr:hypothetical protein [Deltaproteobacteria bacterium]
FDLGGWAWVGSPGLFGLVATHGLFDPNGASPEGMNYYQWGVDPADRDEHQVRFVEIVEEMNTTVDETELTALIHEAEEIIADQVVIIPLYQWAGGIAFDPRQVEGIVANSHMWGTFTWEIERWKKPGFD